MAQTFGDYHNSELGSEFYNALLNSNNIIKPIQIDDTDPNNVYVGYASVGSLTSDAIWLIQKIITSGSLISILTANGSNLYNNIYDDRTSLSYS